MKAYLSTPPLLSPSQLGEELFLYLVVSPVVVSTALIREEERVQKPVYYASRVLRGAKERYLPIEKLAFALVTAAHKLKLYFQAHTVVILIDKPPRRAISNLDAAGRLALWGHRIERVRHPILPANRHQRVDHRRLHNRIHS